jgi:hypothetical protein
MPEPKRKEQNLFNDVKYSGTPIDRKQENKDVAEFQKNDDLVILEKIYKDRIPTLRHWVSQHYYPGLVASEEDLLSELSLVFVKAAKSYDIEKGDFNTCLYTFLLNRLKNIKSEQHAKKRSSEEYKDSKSGMVLSLDYSYENNDNGCLFGFFSNTSKLTDHVMADSNMNVSEILSVLSDNDKTMHEFLIEIGKGHTITDLSKNFKIRKGKIQIKKNEADNVEHGSVDKSKFLLSKLDIDSIHNVRQFKISKGNNGEYFADYEVETVNIYELISRLNHMRKYKRDYFEKLGYIK